MKQLAPHHHPGPAFVAVAIVATCALVACTPALALDSIPLDQLKPGLWRVERKIEKLDLSPVERETRHSEYCASPKKEITRTLQLAAFLCKTDTTKIAENKYSVHATCKLGLIAGTNTTVITIVNPGEYTAEVDTIGTKFGEKQHRKEVITAVRAGDCQE